MQFINTYILYIFYYHVWKKQISFKTFCQFLKIHIQMFYAIFLMK